MTDAYYGKLLKRIEMLEHIVKPDADSLPYYVIVAPVDHRIADQSYAGPCIAYELYKRGGQPDVLRKIHLTDYRQYERPKGCTCTCLYMIRRKCYDAIDDCYLPSDEVLNAENPLSRAAGGRQSR